MAVVEDVVVVVIAEAVGEEHREAELAQAALSSSRARG